MIMDITIVTVIMDILTKKNTRIKNKLNKVKENLKKIITNQIAN